MNYKILVADDSLTIQKVIKITLSSEPYTISECLAAHDLASEISANRPHIVLLDFNLSDKKSGYELCKEIKKIDSQIKIILLFGTFDSFTEEEILASGADGKIVKPFDGTKFINICRSVVEKIVVDDEKPQEVVPIIEEEPGVQEEPVHDDALPGFIEEDEDDMWVVNGPTVVDQAIPEEEEVSLSEEEIESFSELDEQVRDWGIEVPSVIGLNSSDTDSELPSIIEIPEALNESHSVLLPDESDLEYPDMDSLTSSGPSTSLTPVEDLNDSAFTSFEVEESGTTSVEQVRAIEEQIADEIEGGDLWGVDVDFNEESDSEENILIDDIKRDEEKILSDQSELDIEDDGVLEVEDSWNEPAEVEVQVEEIVVAQATPQQNYFSQDEMIQVLLKDEKFKKSIVDALAPRIEKVIQAECRTLCEKVSWEVIPDLAENLIKSELKRISDTVI